MQSPPLPALHLQPPEAAHESLAPLLDWFQRLLAWQMRVTRATFAALADDPYRGLYLPDAEADLLTQPVTIEPNLLQERADLHQERLELAASQPATTPLSRLARRCALDLFEQDVLLMALAPELDSRFERLYAFVQDDVTRRRPSIELALRMLCLDPAERLARRAALAANAPLLRWHLVRATDDPSRPSALLTRTLQLDERIVGELLGQPAIDSILQTWVDLAPPQEPPRLDAHWLNQISAFVGAQPARLVLGLIGQPGSGRSAVAASLAQQLERPLVHARIAGMLNSENDAVLLLERLERECLLRDAVLLISTASDTLAMPATDPRRAALVDFLDRQPGLVVLALEQPWEPRSALNDVEYVAQMLPELTYAQREAAWQHALGPTAPEPEVLARLSSTFRLNPGQIRGAAVLASTLARWRHPQAAIETNDLYAASRAQSSGKLDSLAQKLRPTYHWKDLVLPAAHLTQLREICVQVRQRRTVLETWGFDQHLAMGKGVNVLFAGPSGTGKTMAAEVIASELGLELYRIDLASLVSKYIGETEKNLDRIFQAAREANAILFFDEADALFGKRSEVKDSHDRYANIEVGYLLQKIEAYDGVVILATNLSKNMDDAFVRRLHVAIEFPVPEEDDRLRIWQQVFPAAAPKATDLDLEFAARRFRLSGGNIRNIALMAAFLAAEEASPIAMRHLIQATRREYQKLGRLITASDFGQYLELARH